MKRLLLWIIKTYQRLLSPWIGNQCRFHPTCSEYARIAIEVHGPLKGSYLAARRLLKCHPYSRHWGFDLVPGSEEDLLQRQKPPK